MMGIYVDPLFRMVRSRLWPSDEACHMVADTAEELEVMRRMLDLSPGWLQNTGRPDEHYMLTPDMREKALFYGAKEVTDRGMEHVLRRKRARPPESLAWRRVAARREET